MELLAIIGAIAIFAILIYLGFTYDKYKVRKRKELEFFVKYNSKCAELANPIGIKVLEIPIMKKKIKEILRNGKEREEAYLNKEKEDKVNFRRIQSNERKRKIGYKYQEEIFNIFRYKRKLTRIELLNKIANAYKKNMEESESLLEIWIENWLVKNIVIDGRKTPEYEVGLILNSKLHSKFEDDQTYDEWLETKGINI